MTKVQDIVVDEVIHKDTGVTGQLIYQIQAVCDGAIIRPVGIMKEHHHLLINKFEFSGYTCALISCLYDNDEIVRSNELALLQVIIYNNNTPMARLGFTFCTDQNTMVLEKPMNGCFNIQFSGTQDINLQKLDIFPGKDQAIAQLVGALLDERVEKILGDKYDE